MLDSKNEEKNATIINSDEDLQKVVKDDVDNNIEQTNKDIIQMITRDNLVAGSNKNDEDGQVSLEDSSKKK